jgi:transposase
MVLGFSRAMFAQATTSAGIDAFLACHVAAFETFGGMPAEVLYDNAKVVVLSRAKDRIRFNPAFLDFAGRFGFAPRLCRPYRAKTKGKVERTIGYIKDSFLVGRTFTGLDELNQQLAFWIESKANRRIHATTGERPCDRLRRENLVPFDQAKPWKRPKAPQAKPDRPRFRFEEPRVETRDLSVYEEACL